MARLRRNQGESRGRFDVRGVETIAKTPPLQTKKLAACPDCGAKIGESCVSMATGLETTEHHRSRKRIALRKHIELREEEKRVNDLSTFVVPQVPEVPDDADEPGLAVECPVCGRQPAEPCVTPMGKPARMHADRRKRAENVYMRR